MPNSPRDGRFELEFRPMKLSDNLTDAARLIYQTDDYIYPALFGSVQTAETVLPEVIRRGESCFRPDRFFAAVSGGRMAGLIYYIRRDFKWDAGLFLKAFQEHGIAVPEHFYSAASAYFEKTQRDTGALKGIYILNVCVDSAMRNQGVGTGLLSAFSGRYPSEPISLHVLSDNTAAIRLYQKFGFHIRKETTGYSPVPPHPRCYLMEKESC